MKKQEYNKILENTFAGQLKLIRQNSIEIIMVFAREIKFKFILNWITKQLNKLGIK